MAPQDEIEATIQRVGDDAIGHDPEDITYLSEPGHIVLKNPEPPFRLGRFSVICIICNRMIGKRSFLVMTQSSTVLSNVCWPWAFVLSAQQMS